MAKQDKESTRRASQSTIRISETMLDELVAFCSWNVWEPSQRKAIEIAWAHYVCDVRSGVIKVDMRDPEGNEVNPFGTAKPRRKAIASTKAAQEGTDEQN